ncbi:FAST kinase domain-containing protein 1, partial [Sciurus carolinensis]|nr:FAST kinase domain-containing protein 1 [Sciurus carolinensis]
DTFFLDSSFINMFRLRTLGAFSWRVFQFRPFSCEPLIIQLNKCIDEEQIFDLIERNKATLSEKQVECAFYNLWQLQKQKTNLLKNVACVKDHPQFLTLHNLTTNKIKLMNDDTLVNVLYIIQQFDIKVLSTFSTCLADQHLYFSPLMGKIANIVNRNLETIQDLRSLSVLMVSISSLISQHFREQLLNKTEILFDNLSSSEVDIAKRIVRFLKNVKYRYYPLLERCNKVFLNNMNHLDLDSISKILGWYHFLQFHSFEFMIVAKKKLTQMIPLFDHPASFVKLFVALGPVAEPEEKKHYLKVSVRPSEISILVCAISMLPSPHLDESAISRIEAVLPQCDLNDLNDFATSVLRWIQYDHMHMSSITGKQLKLLRKLDHYGHQRLQQSNNLDQLWEELKSLKADWFRESLVEETIEALQRLMDGINYINVAGIASFISRTNYLSTLLLDRIASVVIEQIEKIHPFSVFAVILPFSILNYDPPQRNEFFGTCMQCLNSHLEFECILDKRKKPIPYGSHNITFGKLPGMYWESNIQIVGSSLPPGAERIAFEFLDSKAFCRNIPHIKGKSAMKKRHLEILGYRVIQV